MNFAIIFGIGLFLTLLVLLLLMIPKASTGGALLEEVTRQGRVRQLGTGSRFLLDSDVLAKPFTMVRSLFAAEPNPELVRKLSLAGYRKRSHADIFLGL